MPSIRLAISSAGELHALYMSPKIGILVCVCKEDTMTTKDSGLQDVGHACCRLWRVEPFSIGMVSA
jgi:hypothetical protein